MKSLIRQLCNKLLTAAFVASTLLATAWLNSAEWSFGTAFGGSPSATPGFFFFNIAKIEDSLSGNGGISSNTVACRKNW